MLRPPLIIFVSFFLLTNLCEAVSINEVAWMGDATSANHEWIELYHDGLEAVTVDGWVLTDGMNLSITLTGTIVSGQYAVLERSNEESAPGSAFLIYTGALVNTGATLFIRDELGNTVDQVSGGEGWSSIGGDNVTKETAQYTKNGWVTDMATPGAVNRSGRVEDTEEEDDDVEENNNEETTKTETDIVNKDKKSPPPAPKKIIIEAPAVAFVSQEVNFKAVTDKSYQTVRYDWNFGDSYTATGTIVTHRFDYPGTYIVSVVGRIKGETIMVEKEISVLPLAFSIGTAPDGAVQLHNDARHDVDVSSYSLYAGRVVTFPANTKIKAKGTITIPRAKLGQNEVRLVLDNGKVLPLGSPALTLKTENNLGSATKPDSSFEDQFSVAKPAESLMAVKEEIVVPAGDNDGNESNKQYFEAVFFIFLVILVSLILWFRPSGVVDDKDEDS